MTLAPLILRAKGKRIKQPHDRNTYYASRGVDKPILNNDASIRSLWMAESAMTHWQCQTKLGKLLAFAVILHALLTKWLTGNGIYLQGVYGRWHKSYQTMVWETVSNKDSKQGGNSLQQILLSQQCIVERYQHWWHPRSSRQCYKLQRCVHCA